MKHAFRSKNVVCESKFLLCLNNEMKRNSLGFCVYVVGTNATDLYVYLYIFIIWHMQATSREIACSDWLRRVTCRSVSFRIGPVQIMGFVSHVVYKRTTKGNFEKPPKKSD